MYEFILFLLIVCISPMLSCGCVSDETPGSDNIAGGGTFANETGTGITSVAERSGERMGRNEPMTSGIPEITPVEVSGDPYEDRTFNVKFEKSEYELVLPVNMSVYYGAAVAEKAIPTGIYWNETDRISEYYRSFFEGEAIGGFYDDITKRIRHIRLAEDFSDEEYLEFMIAFVQQIPYDPDADEPRFPVEVIYDMKGDCDEKSMLLIGMLAHEGYDTALIIFPEYSHATAGIRIITTGDTSFRQFKSKDGRKYVFIESTSPNYIGEYPEYYEDAYAVVVPIGDGALQR